jgi:hypothetical protein
VCVCVQGGGVWVRLIPESGRPRVKQQLVTQHPRKWAF